jgi:hypothetical protein
VGVVRDPRRKKAAPRNLELAAISTAVNASSCSPSLSVGATASAGTAIAVAACARKSGLPRGPSGSPGGSHGEGSGGGLTGSFASGEKA